MPLVSVVIPTHNRVGFIRRAMDSALGQVHADVEVVVVDDASTDGTAELVERLARSEPRVRLLRHDTNGGAQRARNTGLQAARGDFVCFLDSDDELLPDKSEQQLRVFEQSDDPLLGVVHGGWIAQHADRSERRAPLPYQGDVLRAMLLEHPGFPICVMLMRRECLERAGGFDPSILAFQEWDTSIALARHCHFACVDAAVATYHIEGHPSISTSMLRGARGYLQILRKHRAEIVARGGREGWQRQLRRVRTMFFNAGRQYIEAGAREEAVESFREAAWSTGVYPPALAHALVARAGPTAYGFAQRLSRLGRRAWSRSGRSTP